MYKNNLKTKLRNKELVAGCIIQGALPAMVEICGLAGMDFVFIDAEHGPLSERECEELVRAAEIRGIVPLIRVPNPEPDTILRYMDIGAMGVILPGLTTREEAEKVVQAVKYYPRGSRGLAATRSSDYGMRKPLPEYVVEANEETIVLTVIEKETAIENLAEILAVDGLDGVLLGPNDLSQSLGVPGQGRHEKLQAAFAKYLEIGLKSGKPMGTVVRPWESVQQLRDAGLTILLSSAYGLFAGAAKGFVAEFKK